MELTAEIARALLVYEPDSGIILWLPRSVEFFNEKPTRSAAQACAWWNSNFAGKIAGFKDGNGYYSVRVLRRRYFCHRLIWLWMTGDWPADQIDHIDCDKLNNRWANLRAACRSENKANSRLYCNSTSGLKGVTWHKRDRRWQAQIQVNGKNLHLGYFETSEQAHEAYVIAAEKHFGEFARAA